ncbi:MAG: DNA polymerase III subunit delta' [Gammaproteobacteria bacterium]|nr:DNA polymerase III subunit delta' [Gammaproteobacteria bacterium]MBQ0840135.1 DNA polymerase III subunit delta' [Gammaproteobacteria bacterium]
MAIASPAPLSLGQALPWQDEQWQQLCYLLNSNRLPHAIMLSGAQDTGKRHFAERFVQRLFCTRPVDDGACGECKQCRLYLSGGHPDFRRIEPEAAGKAISINAIRELSEFAVITAHQQNWKIALVAPVEAMTLNAANAFLKTLEEPREKTLLLLVHDQLAPVLPTIRSRCRVLSQGLPPPAVARDWLAERLRNDGASVDELLARAGGRPLRALGFAEANTLDDIARFEQVLKQVQTGEAAPITSAAAFEGQPLNQLLEWLLVYYSRQLITTAQRGGKAEPRQFAFYDLLLSTRKKLESKTNLNPQLVLEELFLSLSQSA